MVQERKKTEQERITALEKLTTRSTNQLSSLSHEVGEIRQSLVDICAYMRELKPSRGIISSVQTMPPGGFIVMPPVIVASAPQERLAGEGCCPPNPGYFPPGVEIIEPSNGEEISTSEMFINVRVKVWSKCKILKYVIRYTYPGHKTKTRAEVIELSEEGRNQEMTGRIPRPRGKDKFPLGNLEIYAEVKDECGESETDEVTITVISES